MQSRLVSIISPAYNASTTIEATIRSVLAQSYSDWEMLIADDGSSDDTLARIQPYTSDKRIRCFKNEQNIGSASTRNRLLQEAQGRYVAFLDADDEWLPTKLEEQLSLMQTTKIGLCCSGYTRRFADSNTKTIDIIPPAMIKYQDLLQSNLIPMLTAIVDREQHGNIQFAIKPYEDYQLWLDLTRQNHVCVSVQKILAVYHAGNPQSVSGNKLRAATWHWSIMSQEAIPLHKKVAYFMNYVYQGIRKNSV